METLFFLVVLAIIIVSNIVNIKKRLKDASSGEPSGGQKEGKSGVKDVIARIKSELEQATAEPAGERQRSSGWEGLISGYGAEPRPAEAEPAEKASADTVQKAQSAEKRQPEARKKSGKTLMESLKHQGKTPEARMDRADRADRQTPEKKIRPEELQRQVPAAAEPQSRRPGGEKPAPVYGMTGRGRRRVYSAKQLRQAVVWSEILGRPIGLRGQDPHVWM